MTALLAFLIWAAYALITSTTHRPGSDHGTADARSVLDLLDSDYSFLNEPLAQFYGIDGIKGPPDGILPVTNTDFARYLQ